MDSKQIYEEYHMKVLRYIQNKVNDYYLAEDLCSDVFMKVYQKLDTFDDTKASISTWIFTITRNRLIDYYRTRKVMVEIPETLTYDYEGDSIDSDQLEMLAKGLESLSDKERNLIVKHYYEGKTIKQAAEEMGISYTYAKILHKKALINLKNYVEWCTLLRGVRI